MKTNQTLFGRALRRVPVVAAAVYGLFLVISSQYALAAFVTVNVSPYGTATQSTTYDANTIAAHGNDGNTDGNYGDGSITHTQDGDPSPYWQVQLPVSVHPTEVKLWNRTGCCGARLSSMFVDVQNVANVSTGNSGSLNPANVQNDPLTLSYLPTGTSTVGNKVVVTKGADGVQPDLISLAEAQVFATNLADGQPATQSSGYAGNAFPAGNAVNGTLGDFTHTDDSGSDPQPWWEVDLARSYRSTYPIDSIMLWNRGPGGNPVVGGGGCCQDRLNNITVQLFDENHALVYTSAVLNPANTLNGPAFLAVDFQQLLGGAQLARYVRVAKNGDILSLGEVQVFGVPEPSSLTLLGLGTLGLCRIARRRKA